MYYSEDFVVLLKPAVLRFWIRSVAIRDVDDIIADLLGVSDEA